MVSISYCSRDRKQKLLFSAKGARCLRASAPVFPQAGAAFCRDKNIPFLPLRILPPCVIMKFSGYL